MVISEFKIGFWHLVNRTKLYGKLNSRYNYLLFQKVFCIFCWKDVRKKVYRLNKKLINQFSTDAQAVDWFCSERSAPTLQGNLKIVACNEREKKLKLHIPSTIKTQINLVLAVVVQIGPLWKY